MTPPATPPARIAPASEAPAYNLLQVELFRHAILSIADELETNLTRTAYSLLVYEYKDYCIGLMDRDFRLIAQSRGSLPIFVADMGLPLKDAVEVIGVDRLEPGDVFLTNYAPAAGQHLNNVVVATPIFDRAGALMGYLCVRAHWADLGGLAPGSVTWAARDIFQEGVQYRGLKIIRRGEIQPEVMATIEANTRLPKWVMGDLNAQLGACRLGLERWAARIVPRWSDEDVRGLMAELLRTSAERARRRIREILPDGRYEAECRLDDAGPTDPRPMTLRLALDVRDGEVEVDFTGMPDESRSPINTGEAAAVSAARVAFKALLDPDIPVNEGFFDPIRCRFRPGTIVSAGPTAPLGYWNNAIATFIDLVLKAVGDRRPELAPAGHHASFGVFSFRGHDENGALWMFMDTAHGGRGGHANGPGFGALKTLAHGDTRDIPVEMMESRFPLFCHSYRFRPGSGGAGLNPGGPGTERVIEVLADGVDSQFSLDRTLDPPWGMAGGEPGSPGDIECRPTPQDEWRSVKKGGPIRFDRGALIRVRSAGGGGWGAPVGKD